MESLIPTGSSQVRANKSTTAGRLNRNPNEKLRKIAEGLEEFQKIKFNSSSVENSTERPTI